MINDETRYYMNYSSNHIKSKQKSLASHRRRMGTKVITYIFRIFKGFIHSVKAYYVKSQYSTYILIFQEKFTYCHSEHSEESFPSKTLRTLSATASRATSLKERGFIIVGAVHEPPAICNSQSKSKTDRKCGL